MIQESSLDVTIVTKQKIYDELDFSLINESFFNWVICPSGTSFTKLFKSRLAEFNQADIVFFNTLASNFRFFSKLDYKAKVVLRVHNANTFFAPFESIKFKFNLYYLYKDISHIIRKNLFELEMMNRRKFLKCIDYVSLPNQEIEDYCREKGYLKEVKVMPEVPICFNQFNTTSKSMEEVSVTIPGTIDDKRKDYELVYEAIQSICPQLNSPLKLTLLGRPKGPYGRRMVKLFNGLSNDGIQVSTFSDKVTENEWGSIMRNTDFLILPLVQDTRFHIYHEVYGKTKASGAINDMIRFGKPALILDYKVGDGLESVTEVFQDSHELSKMLLQWINDRKYLEVKNEAFEAYSLNKMRAKIIDAFGSVLHG